MNDNRPMLKALFRLVVAKQINRVIVEHKDRLTRFNFAFLVVFFESYGVEIEWISDTLESSYEAELVKDIISLMASMSGKVYGKRSADRRKQSSKKKNGCATDLMPNPPEAI